jgi:ribonucleoside-diphosphate reductase alpha chain
VVVGGVRRSALICLSDLNDDYLRNAKSGQWWISDPHRQLANISAVYERKPSMETFMREWVALYNSKSGERGIFSREASQAVAAKYGRRDETTDYGTNPCSEIILRPDQFCNLSEVVVRENDNVDTLLRKVRLATILGTLQATQTNFRYLSKRWKNNTEEEALLGVSLTGIMDNHLMNSPVNGLANTLVTLREEAVKVNKEFAKILGINQSAAITCVKPSGTVSQLVDSASGIHPRYAHYYVRRVRNDKKDPLADFMVSHGYAAEDDFYGTSRLVFSFPQKAPEGAVTVKDVSAIQQLELWKVYQEHWCEHKPSITVYVDEHEWLEVGAWVYANIDSLSGVSFLPRDNGSYRQAPYEELTEEQYKEMLKGQSLDIDWTQFRELTDNTESAKTLACVAGVCEI